MTDSPSIRPSGEPPTVGPVPAGPIPVQVGPAAADRSPALPADSVRLPVIPGSAAVPANAFSDPPGAVTKPKLDRPWALTSLNVRYAPERVLFGNSTIHFQQPAFGTDLTIKDVAAQDRTSFEYLYTMPNGWPQLDEPQTTMGISGQFANNFGFEANLKHNKYIVKDRSQMVQFDGTIGGQEVHGVKPLSDFVGQYEISGGLNQVSALATYAVPLPAFSPKDRFSLIAKAGPGVLVTYTNSHLKNGDGVMEEGPHQYHLGGVSAVAETELRYEIRKKLALSVSNSFSYMNVRSSQIAGGGKASQTILASQVAVGLGYTFNIKDKKKPPVDPMQ